ncbi:chemotaxis protein CheB [Solirubrobacter sp. CPCC 204708]|uniref:protein-glutamate methylesterase n=1 Tax=Solirubrobacter deserti TaxID=2282478 RepID=A0ABT4RCN6_9ACTN|nr:chemotaxis protein CheB [Solirubrobacter deserti]MBE2315659.1 chemotaxis protein CheB [Solirubrobacter deserti]MDA0136299.1 chemotaxis protein CheB [Solirubrobacter deserti]
MTGYRLIVIGASWGGLHAVGEILAGLPADFEPTVLVVQHRAEDAEDLLAGLLDRRGPLHVREVEDKDALHSECVLVAPAGYHVLVEPDHFALSTEAEVRFSRPSIDVTLESAADALGPAVVGVVLTGANDDGAEGLAAVRRRGGYAIVQNPATAEASTMPAAARGSASVVAELPDIAALLRELA